MASAFGIVASFTLGLIGQAFPALIPFIVFLVTMIGAQVVRYFSIGAPGFFFFTFAMILGTYIPFEVKDYPFAIGLVALGTMVANVMVLLYSLRDPRLVGILHGQEHLRAPGLHHRQPAH